MKSFSQFLNEEEARQGRLLNRKNQEYKDINNPNPGNRGYATDPTPTPASEWWSGTLFAFSSRHSLTLSSGFGTAWSTPFTSPTASLRKRK